MKLYLPVILRKSILSCLVAMTFCTLGSWNSLAAPELTLGRGASLDVDFADSETVQNLGNGSLQLSGGAMLKLSNTGVGNGRIYTLFTGVSGLVDAAGHAFTLDESNNAVSLYFDTKQPGTGFWADATLQLVDGALQLVRHHEPVQEPLVVSTRQTKVAEYSFYSRLEFNDITYSVPPLEGYGGAINRSSIRINNNGSVSFSGNKVSPYSSGNYGEAKGGAIYGGKITLNGNGSVSFSGNRATPQSFYNGKAAGGALYAFGGDTIELNNNGSVSFVGNVASASYSSSSLGGAIYGSVMLNNNGAVSFTGNKVSSSASAKGAAIYARKLVIQNNESVLFEKNVEINDGRYELCSISAGGDVLSLSAATGKSIEFRDSISIHTGSAFNLNADFVDDAGQIIRQQGDIFFTGAYVEAHLQEMKGSAGSSSEILNSRTSEVTPMTHLYGGRLRIEDGAVYQGRGITVHENSDAWVCLRNASLLHNGYDIKFGSYTTLELTGSNQTSGNLLMEDGSALSFHLDGENALNPLLSHTGTLTLGGRIDIILDKTVEELEYGDYQLIALDGKLTGWNAQNVVINGGTIENSALQWKDDVLWLSYYDLKLPNINAPELHTATWSNREGDGRWNTSSINWRQDEFNYEYKDGVAVVFGNDAHGVVTLEGELAPRRVLVNNDAAKDYSFVGNGSLVGDMKLTKEGAGTLAISTDNAFTGGTEIKAGVLVAAHANALGSGGVLLNGGTLEIGAEGVANSISIMGDSALQTAGDVTHVLGGTPISNSGTLTMSGHFNASALDFMTAVSDQRYALDGSVVEHSQSGFAMDDKFMVQIVAGGTTHGSEAFVIHSEHQGTNPLHLGADGWAWAYGDGRYSTFYLEGVDSLSVSEIAGVSLQHGETLNLVVMGSGMLTIDQSIGVAADGGSIVITKAATLSGTIENAVVSTAAGSYTSEISAVMGGSSSLEVSGGSISVSGDNLYTGGTEINGGILEIDHVSALGTGAVQLNNGRFDMNDYAVSNQIHAYGGTLSGASQYAGKLVVDGHLNLDAETSAAGGIEISRGSLSGGSIHDTDILVDAPGESIEISSDITGESSLLLEMGNLVISGNNNDYTGGTVINGGNLTIGKGSSLGTGTITINGGALDANGLEITNDVINNGGILVSSYVLSAGRTLLVGQGGMHLEGNLSLAGGNLVFEGMPLTVSGNVETSSPVNVSVSSYSMIDQDGTVQLADFGSSVAGVTIQSFNHTGYGTLNYDDDEHILSITLTEKNVWGGGRYFVWRTGANAGWQDYRTFVQGNRVVFNTGGFVTIVGGVDAASILVDIEKNLSFRTTFDKKSGMFRGSIMGSGCLVKRGAGALILNDGNSYSGGTYIEAGSVIASGAGSFGTGGICLVGGTLDLKSKAVANAITLSGAAAVKNGARYLGSFTMTGGELLKGSVLNVTDTATLSAGTINGTLSGYGNVDITGAVTLGDTGKLNTSFVTVSSTGALTIGSKGLALGGKNAALSVDGKLVSASKLSTNELQMNSGTLTIAGAKAANLDIKGKGITNTFTDATVNVSGAMNVTGNLEVNDDSHITLADINTDKPKAMGLTVKGDLKMNIPAEGEPGSYDKSDITLTGKLSAGRLEMTNAEIVLENEKAQNIALTQAKDASKNEVTNVLTNSRINANGSMTVAGHLRVQGDRSSIHLWDASAKPKAMGLTVKGSLFLEGGSITLSGALSAKDMELNGGTITMTGSKQATIKVSNALTLLEGGVDLNFDAGIVDGKSYKIITFKTIGDGDTLWDTTATADSVELYDLLGLSSDACTLTLDVKKKCITMTVIKADGLKTSASQTMAVSEDDEEDETVPADSSVAAPAALVQPDYTPVADALVQANWGLVETSRAFVNTIANRSMAVQLGSGERAVWASAIGGSSRRSSNAGHYGADTSITGGAIGMETQLGESSLLGAALGNSWTRVSAHGFDKIKQDTTHFGLYGQTNWGVLSADWSAAYGRSESRSNGSSWNQQSIQLDARLSYNHALTDNTLLRGFAGAQYYGHDSATVDGIETGKVQNLRAEVGVGIVRYTEKSSVYAEVALLQDVARHNPEVRIPDGQSYRGINPGRTGVNITVGGSYALSEQWSLNASYTAEIVENATSHSINAGATYKF